MSMHYWGGPPQQPVYYPVGYPIQPQGDREYEKYLRRELKELKKAKKEEGDKKKDDKKQTWWKRVEIVSIAIFTAPLLAPAYLGIVKLSWIICKNIFTN